MLQRGRRLSVYQRPPSNSDILFEADYSHDLSSTTCETCDGQKRVRRTPPEFDGPEIHYGLIASGDRVVKSTVKRGEIIRNVGDVLCFEIEAAGLMSEFPCIVVRGISDYADSHKNDDWLAYIDPKPAPVSALSADAASNRDSAAAGHVFHGKGIQNSGSGSFSVGNDLNIY